MRVASQKKFLVMEKVTMLPEDRIPMLHRMETVANPTTMESLAETRVTTAEMARVVVKATVVEMVRVEVEATNRFCSRWRLATGVGGKSTHIRSLHQKSPRNSRGFLDSCSVAILIIIVFVLFSLTTLIICVAF
jgi:hypothetical protein